MNESLKVNLPPHGKTSDQWQNKNISDNKWGLRVLTNESRQPNMFLLLFLSDKGQISLTGHIERQKKKTKNIKNKSS